MLVVVVWLILTSNTPSQHRFISKAEKKYITSSLAGQVSEGGNDVSGMLFTNPLTGRSLSVVLCAMVEVCHLWSRLGHYRG